MVGMVRLLAMVLVVAGCLDWSIHESSDGEDVDVGSDSDMDVDTDADVDTDSDSDIDSDTDSDGDVELDVDVDADASGWTCSVTIECARDSCEGPPNQCFLACAEYACPESQDAILNLSMCMLAEACMLQCTTDLGCWRCLENNFPDEYGACMSSRC
jgi:hypothetical protein